MSNSLSAMANNINKNIPFKCSLSILDIEKYFELPYHVYLKDEQGLFLECNAAQASTFGVDNAKTVVGCRDLDFICEKENDIIKKNDQEILQTNMPKILLEYGFIDRQPTPYLSYKFPLLGLNGKTLGIFGISICLENNLCIPSSLSLPTTSSFPHLHQEAKINEKQNITNREKECLFYLTQGMTAKQVARKLNISPRTVEHLIDNMKRKFHCSTRAELIYKITTKNL